jgi:hypothetical protein
MIYSIIMGVVLGLSPGPQFRIYATLDPDCTAQSAQASARTMAAAMATKSLQLNVTNAQCVDAATLRGLTDHMTPVFKDKGTLTFARNL